jgi:hypothetical protein
MGYFLLATTIVFSVSVSSKAVEINYPNGTGVMLCLNTSSGFLSRTSEDTVGLPFKDFCFFL